LFYSLNSHFFPPITSALYIDCKIYPPGRKIGLDTTCSKMRFGTPSPFRSGEEVFETLEIS